MMRKTKVSILTIMASMIVFTGCGAITEEVMFDMQEESAEETDGEEANDNEAVENEVSEEEASVEYDQIANWNPVRGLQTNGDTIFLLHKGELLAVNQETGEATVLFQSEKGKEGYAYYSSFCLYQNWVYFITDYEWSADTCAIWRVEQNGENAVKVAEGISSRDYSMACVEDVLYLSGGLDFAYQINEDGSLTDITATDSVLAKMPEESSAAYAMIGYQSGFYIPAVTKSWNGKYFLNSKSGADIFVDGDTGEEVTIPLPEGTSVIAMTPEYLVLRELDEETYYVTQYSIMDLETQEYKVICDIRNATIVDCTEQAVYISYSEEQETGKRLVYEEIDVASGATREVLAVDTVPGMYQQTINGVDNFSVLGDKIYYMYGENGRINLYVKELSDQENGEILYAGIEDAGWGDLGNVQAESGSLYFDEDPSIQTASYYVEYFILDGDTPGIKKINDVLKAEAEQDIAYGRSLGDDMDASYVLEDYFVDSSYSSTFSGVTYNDGQYICLWNANYDYQGGAHGMPGRIYHVFDLESGEDLKITDIIGNTEEELNEIIVEAFTEYAQDPDSGLFPEGLDGVRESAGFTTDFYLTEEGICFFFYPYAIGPYAAGFPEVVIPYEEFDMRIM